MAAAGALILLAAFWLYRKADGDPTFTLIAEIAALVSGTVLMAGLVSLYFVRATERSFEWLIAWRYLRTRKSSWVALVVGAVLLVIGIGLVIAQRMVDPGVIGELLGGPTRLQRQLQAGAMGFLVVGVWALFFGVLIRLFSVFTSISVLGVYLGTLVLVVVLSVMGGFENDLRQKILGTRAHLVVTKPKRMFADYRQVLKRVDAIADVRAVAPYIDGEVMITSQSNLSGVLLRGIDPARISRVTDLRRYLKAEGGSGSLENLVDPKRLASIPETPLLTVERARKKAKAKAEAKAQDKEGGAQEGPRQSDAGRASGPTPASAPTSAPTSAPSMPDGSDYRGVGPKAAPREVYPGIIVGAELARNLRLYVGDDVNLIAPLGGMSPAGPIPKSRPFRVAGIFYSGMYEYDTKFAYVTIPVAQRFLGLDDEITGMEIKADSVEQATPLAATLRARLGPAFEVKDWKQLNRNLFSALKLEKVVMFIVLTFIVVVAAFAIVITLTMIVLEKTREIAALKAIGANRSSLLRVFVFSGIYIGIIGMLVGVLHGLGVCSFLAHVGLPLDPEVYYISRLPVRVDPGEILLVAIAALSLSFAATIHPALMAARLRPVEGLRYD